MAPFSWVGRMIDSAIKAVAVARGLDRSASEIVSADSRSAFPEWADIGQYGRQASIYTISSWVYIAVNRVAQSAALAKFTVQEKIGTETRELPNHPIEALLDRPNADMSRFELLMSTFAFREIAGNAYWYLAGPDGGAPTEILPLRPDRVRIVGNDSGQGGRRVGGYIYDVDGIQIPLHPDRVIHFPLFNPTNDYYGLSRIQIAGLAAQTDQAMARWNMNYFGKDKAVPAGIVNIKSMVSNRDFERMKREFKESYGGTERKTAFIRGGSVEWQDIGLSHKDLDFLPGRMASRDEIFMIWGIHPGSMDKNSTEANAQVGESAFISNTVWPAMKSFTEKLTNELAPYFGQNLIVEPEDIRIKDSASERADIALESRFLTINEIRKARYNQPPINEEWADKPAVSGGSYRQVQQQSSDGASDTQDQNAGQEKLLDSGDQAIKAGDRKYIEAMARQIVAELSASATIPIAVGQTGNTIKASELLTPVDGDEWPTGNVALVGFNQIKLLPTPAAAKEIDQFTRKVSKRTGSDRKAAIDTFTFDAVPTASQIAIKAWADVDGDLDMLNIKAADHRARRMQKEIAAHSDRIDTRGNADPLGREKLQAGLKVQSALSVYLRGLRSRIIEGLNSVQSGAMKADPTDKMDPILAYFNDEWWALETDKMGAMLRPAMYDAFYESALQTFNMIEMTIGVSLDPSIFNVEAAKWAAKWTDTVLKSLGATNQEGTGALVARWIATPGATNQDLTAALMESNLFDESRAAIIAETEITRAMAAGTYSSASELANAVNIPVAVDETTLGLLCPAHPWCRCWITVRYIADESGLIRIDFEWHTVRDAAVCMICGPREGRLVSEL